MCYYYCYKTCTLASPHFTRISSVVWAAHVTDRKFPVMQSQTRFLCDTLSCVGCMSAVLYIQNFPTRHFFLYMSATHRISIVLVFVDMFFFAARSRHLCILLGTCSYGVFFHLSWKTLISKPSSSWCHTHLVVILVFDRRWTFLLDHSLHLPQSAFNSQLNNQTTWHFNCKNVILIILLVPWYQAIHFSYW